MAAALGRCLLMAASQEAPVATPVVEVRGPSAARLSGSLALPAVLAWDVGVTASIIASGFLGH